MLLDLEQPAAWHWTSDKNGIVFVEAWSPNPHQILEHTAIQVMPTDLLLRNAQCTYPRRAACAANGRRRHLFCVAVEPRIYGVSIQTIGYGNATYRFVMVISLRRDGAYVPSLRRLISMTKRTSSLVCYGRRCAMIRRSMKDKTMPPRLRGNLLRWSARACPEKRSVAAPEMRRVREPACGLPPGFNEHRYHYCRVQCGGRVLRRDLTVDYPSAFG